LSSSVDSRTRRRAGAIAAAATLFLLAFAFIGRLAVSSDGAEVVSESFGWLVNGEPTMGLTTPGGAEGYLPGRIHSRYGLWASLLPLPFLGTGWLLRGAVGVAGLEAFGAVTWSAGVALAALAFLGLVRALRPGASALWAPAFVAGTFLWPYAADSYSEPWAAAALAFGARAALGSAPASPLFAGLAFAAAALLRPVYWSVAPVLLLAEALPGTGGSARWRAAALSGLALAAGAGAAAAANLLRFGSLLETGYGDYVGEFTTPLLRGVYGLVLSPGRGLVWYAPLALVALLGAGRLDRRARVLLYGTTLVALAVVARWWAWHGASAWGPRLLLPVLPLVCAPAALVAGRAVRGALLAGALLNLPGVLIAPGAWMGWVESLAPPPGESWPQAGNVRTSVVPALTPLWGHPWLLFRWAHVDAPAPWRRIGAGERVPPPSAAQSVSPWWLRKTAGFPRIPSMVVRLLERNAWGFLDRGRFAEAERLAAAALTLDPHREDAARILREARASRAAGAR
jgi:hypothetical protein